jgi:dCTP deaminase
MSILLHQEILDNYKSDKIVIVPFSENQIGPNSYDVRISDTLKTYSLGISRHLDPKKQNKTKTIEIPKSGYILKPGKLYLASTIESIGSKYFIPMYEGRSSMARLGIQSHISAGFGDIGFISKWTLEINVMHPVKIYPGMRIGQIYFHRINQEYNFKEYQYKGKYLIQKDPQESLSYYDKDL